MENDADMRGDMAKVLVERPRPTSGWNKPGLYRRLKKFHTSADDAPAKESMTRRYEVSGNGKSFNENLAPLRRFLARRVGRPWDKVYSELSANVNRGNPVQKHIFTHLWDFVARDIHERAGMLFVSGRGQWVPLEEGNHEYFVDAKGFLRINKRLRRKERAAAWRKRNPRPRLDLGFEVVIQNNRTFALVRVADGSRQWFEVALKPINGAENWDVLFRKAIGEVSQDARQTAYGKQKIHAAQKRPLSSAEIKRFKLSDSAQK